MQRPCAALRGSMASSYRISFYDDDIHRYSDELDHAEVLNAYFRTIEAGYSEVMILSPTGALIDTQGFYRETRLAAVEHKSPAKPTISGHLLYRGVTLGIWAVALFVMSGPFVIFVQALLWLATGQWPDWRLFDFPLGPLLMLSALAICLTGYMSTLPLGWAGARRRKQTGQKKR